MSERKSKSAPVVGEKLRMAHQEARDPDFLKRLTSAIFTQAMRSGLIQNGKLGSKTPDDLAMDIIEAVLAGRRKWADGQSFYQACGSAVRSTLSNWVNKASNLFEWKEVNATFEEWIDEEEEGVVISSASGLMTPDVAAIEAEAKKRYESDLMELARSVEPGSLDEQIVLDLMDENTKFTRQHFMQKHAVSGSDYDAAMKRLHRLGAKITAKGKE